MISHLLARRRLLDVLSLGSALPRFAVEVVCSRGLDGSFVFGQVCRLKEGFVEEFFLAEDAAGGLVVEELGELEEERVIDGGLGFLIGLERC